MIKLLTVCILGILLYTFTTFGVGLCLANEQAQTTSELMEASYSEMVKGDLHRDAGNITDAVLSYKTALAGFVRVAQKNPELDSEVVRFRIAYCDNQLESLLHESISDESIENRSPSGGKSIKSIPVQSASAAADGAAIQLDRVREQISKRQLTEARDSLIAMMKRDPDEPEIRILMGVVQCMLGRFDDAENMLTTLIEEHPGIPQAYVILATAKMGLGDAASAGASLKKAIELNTVIPEAYYNMAKIILSTEPVDQDSARAHYIKSIELGGDRDTDLDYLLK